jgi:putative two-component system response regulator
MDAEVRILAVDDDPMVLDVLEMLLAELDIKLYRAGNGQEALDLLSTEPDMDAILLDLEMPVMNGTETLNILKLNDCYRNIPVIVVTANRDEAVKTLAQGANDFLSKPYDPDELRVRIMNHVRRKKLTDLSEDMNQVLESELVKKNAALQKALNLSKEAEYEISLRLGMAAEYRDLETGMHTRRISVLSKALAILAGLSDEDAEVLHYASPLHDVGKIGISDRILLKPGKLDAGEFDIMKMHSVIGGKILTGAERYPLLEAGKIIALQHHERWDGSGYPHGLSGTNIHIFARIVSIVDVFDALTSERPYKKAFSFEKARKIMLDGLGTFFDPTLLAHFFDQYDQFVKIKEDLRDLPVEEEVDADMLTFA